MAAVGAEVTGSGFLSSGVVGFFILLLLLSIFLTALCSNCNRRSFELRDSEVNKTPSALIRVVKLEDTRGARENPMINEIQKDEKEFKPNAPAAFTPWRSHLGAPQDNQDVQTNGSAAVMETRGDSDAGGGGGSNPGGESSVQNVLWRSHLRASQKQDVNSFTAPDPTYHTIGGGQSDADAPSPPTNHEPEQEGGVGAADLSDRDRNSVYAKVSKKVRQALPPVHTPEVVQVEEEESSPPLPDRKAEMEG